MKIRAGKTIPSLALLAFSFISVQRSVAATLGDYDGDGKTDAAIIDADKPEDKTSVFVKLSRSGSIRSYVFFPFGNDVISGNFYVGNARTYPGIVAKRGSNLQWRIKKANGRENVFTFGVRADKIPNQGDLDCDGTTDYVLVHQEQDGSRTWQAKLSSDPTNTATTSFGSTGDFVFTGDVDGDGCSEIGVISAGYVWSTRSFAGSTVTDVAFGLPGDIPLPPADLTGDSIPEYISVRAESGRQVAHIRASDTSETTVTLGGAKTVPMVGNFFGTENNFGWLDRANSLVVEITPADKKKRITGFANPRRGLLRPDGIGIPEGKIGRFGSAS